MSGNLLEGFTIANVSIKDSAGAPFLVADSVSLNYGLRPLVLKRLELTDVRLVRPLVVMDRPPGDSSVWNYKAIFQERHDRQSLRDTTKTHFGDWIVLRERHGARRHDDHPLAVEAEGNVYRRGARLRRSRSAVAGKERVVVERRGRRLSEDRRVPRR